MKAGNRPKNIIILCAALLLILTAALPVRAASAQSSGAGGNTVRMGYFDFGGMFDGAADGVKKSGYCYEYMMQLATYTGWNYEFCYGSYAELYEKLKAGEIDILPYTNYNEQRGQEVLFSDKALAEEEYYIAVRAGAYTGTEALNGAVITTLEGADYNGLLKAYLEENSLDVQIRYYSDLDETWDAVHRGEADATVFTSNAYSNDGWDCVCIFGKKPTYIAVAQDREDLLVQLNESTARIDIDDPALLGELYAQYFSDNPMRLSLSAEEQQWVSEHPVLKVGGFVNDAPYLEIDPDTGKAEGLTVDVVNGIIERLGLDASAEFTGYGTLQEMEDALAAGELDVILPFYPDHYIAQQHGLAISKTVRVSNMEIVYRNGTSYQNAVKKIATPVTKLGAFYVQNTFPDSEIVGAVSIQDAVDKVRSGAANGAVAQNVVLHNIKEKYNDLNYVVLPEGCGTCFAALPENFTLIRILNRGLNYFSSAEISAIASQYTLEPNVTTMAFLASHREAVIILALIGAIFVILAVALVQMGRLKQKADEASRSKTRFLFNMSHDIRTPMNAITGFTRMARKDIQDTEKVEEYLEKINISGQQLLTLVNQILEMARIESGRIELEETPVNICREYEHAVTVLAEQAAAGGLNFRPLLENVTHPYVLADVARMNSIILNITGNAMKYTPSGGNIDFCLKEIPARKEGCASFVFTVRDTGIGMSREYQRILFEPFTREKNSTVSRIQGAGLGMSIVRNLVDLMGGRIEVQSEPGKGTEFDITIDFRIDENGAAEPEAEQAASVSLKGCRVLLVEDNEMNREIAKDILEEEGLSVEEADDGTAAVELLRKKGPAYYDFILMDIQMPVMNGYEATRAIRAMYPKAALPIIALSANAFAEDRAASMEAGMDDHVAKPINIRELNGALAKFL